ncbi:MAG: DUF4445 domain-containing protein, partial [Clostridia bacterium]|nr:DUF4445 domain-containing protein [Clostridia bacterium]
MPFVNILENGLSIECADGSVLLNVLHESGCFIESPCAGTGVCGKCRVRVFGGNASPLTEDEKRLLKPEEIEKGIRLSCMVKVKGDIDVELPGQEKGNKVLTSGFMPDFERDSFDGGYGVAVDIGTTTVVASLIDMKTGEEIASASEINAQKRFGLDVLTRITYEYENPEKGCLELQKAIVGQLDSMISKACGDAQVDPLDIREVSVAANCTMTHMLLGVDARPLGRSPYVPVFKESKEVKCSDIGIDVCGEAKLYCLPQVSAYIGADIVAGARVCDMENEKGNALFIDIGTNGEIVLASGGRLLCCSCAAGPALEGANISCGMRAAEGAVEEIEISEDKTDLKVIGDVHPLGLCGSGILAAVRELLDKGYVKPSGVFVKKSTEGPGSDSRLVLQGVKRAFALNDNILITQDDVRQVQLAKGAILSGFTALLNKAGIGMDDLDKVLIAGQFGAHLPAHSPHRRRFGGSDRWPLGSPRCSASRRPPPRR